MKITIKDFEFVGERRRFFKPMTLIIDGVNYLVYTAETTVENNGTITLEMEASKNWIVEKEKEEKKMLNVDRYREDIKNYPLMNIECYLAELRGGEKCKRAKCEECLKNSLRWLFYEHEPPLIKNGDGLKPGDWIMVRGFDHRNWTKMMFIGYFNGCFFTIDGESETCAVGYKQARLPEDGE